MLTIDQKEAILRRAGTTVPDFPSARPPASEGNACPGGDTPVPPRGREAPRMRRQAIDAWSAAVAALYVEHLAALPGKR
ncbi:hypothetical protein QTI33_18865 [Variovorax sp. J22P271]|uniref:hypothetical protein n=1 Tax=Variovorax davisae TaxID=3053515 RepID=UPI002578E970|nr:hypothetical protein [Variovorax sp. J22P271]MDM0034203.1 hypothetical protein [Variovorax sp. J22P271]